jgi:geranylgeranyl pyrophosphate synthase
MLYQNIYILILIIVVIIVGLVYYLYNMLKSYNSLLQNTFLNDNNNESGNDNNNKSENDNKSNNETINSNTNYKYLYEPVEYYKSMKGKNMRNHMATFIGNYFNINSNIIDEACNSANELHNASLIIDDIQDGSLKRREMDCAHIVYGIPVSLSSAYLSIFNELSTNPNKYYNLIDAKQHKSNNKEYKDLSDDIIKQLVSYKCLQIALKNCYLAHLGQALDIYWANKKIIPSEEEYYYMINAKTGLGFTGSLDLYYNLTNNVSKTDYDKFYNLLTKFSQFFQIRDDYINLTDPDFWAKKGYCEDFDEKKYSYLIIKYNNTLLEKQKFFDLFYKQNLTNSEKSALIKKLDAAGIFKDTYKLLTELKSEVNAVIDLNIIFDLLPIKEFNIDLISSFE